MDQPSFTPNRHLVLALRIILGAQLLTLILGVILHRFAPIAVIFLTYPILFATVIIAGVIYLLYRLHPYTKEKIALQKKLEQIQSELISTEASLKNPAQSLAAKIPGIGTKAKQRLAAAGERHTQLTTQRDELQASLDERKAINFRSYLAPYFSAVLGPKTPPKLAAVAVAVLLGITTLGQFGQSARSSFAVLESSVPTFTPTYTLTFTPTLTSTVTPTCTSTWTLTPTITRTPTITLTPTITNTPTITLTPTITPTSTRTFTPTPTRTITPTITRTFVPLPTSTPICNCNIDYDCSNFSTHNQAQACFVYCGGSTSYDWSSLDSDGDGIACESLP